MIWVPASSVPGESPLLGFQLLLCPHVGDSEKKNGEGDEGKTGRER